MTYYIREYLNVRDVSFSEYKLDSSGIQILPVKQLCQPIFTLVLNANI